MRLDGRRPGDCFRVWVAPKQAPYILLEPATEAGLARLTKQVARVTQEAPNHKALHAALVVDRAGRLVFCGEGVSERFFQVFSRFLENNLHRLPALIAFANAGWCPVDVDFSSPQAIAAIQVHRQHTTYPDVWAELLQADVQSVAAVLEDVLPGESMWYWFAPKAPTPLLLQPLHTDPFGKKLNHQIAHMTAEQDFGSRSGRCIVKPSGQLQFDTWYAKPRAQQVLADWVRQHVAAHPVLGRLVHARFGETDALPEAWSEISGTPAPATPAAAADWLAHSTPEDACWFWLGEGPVLMLQSMAQDPDARHFQHRTERLYALRSTPGLSGILKRLSSSSILFTCMDGDLGTWNQRLGQYIRRCQKRHPDILALQQSRAVVVQDGRITAAQRFTLNTPSNG
jgi:hypothetical protein